MPHCGGSCCGGPDLGGTRRFFGKEAARYGRSFERKGPDAAQQALIDLVQREGGPRGDVLAIGCGVGPVHLSLLGRGVGYATGIDIAAPMLEEARRQADRVGLSDRVDYRVGDFVALAAELPDADLAVLDKVVGGYEDVDAIVDASMAKTHRLLAMSFPRDIWLSRLILRIVSGVSKGFGGGFHPYLHDWRRMGQRSADGGVELAQSARTLAWQINIYRRPTAERAAA